MRYKAGEARREAGNCTARGALNLAALPALRACGMLLGAQACDTEGTAEAKQRPALCRASLQQDVGCCPVRRALVRCASRAPFSRAPCSLAPCSLGCLAVPLHEEEACNKDGAGLVMGRVLPRQRHYVLHYHNVRSAPCGGSEARGSKRQGRQADAARPLAPQAPQPVAHDARVAARPRGAHAFAHLSVEWVNGAR